MGANLLLLLLYLVWQPEIVLQEGNAYAIYALAVFIKIK